MARRPIAHKQIALPTAGLSSEVRKEINDVGLMLLREVKKRLSEKIENEDMGNLSLKELLSEYNKAVKSLQGPATSITAINVPPTPQEQVQYADRAREIKNSALHPDNIIELRKRQEKYLEDNPET